MKALPATPASPVAALVGTPDAPHPIRLPATAPAKVIEDDPSTRILATHVGDPDGVSGSWLQSGPAKTVAAIWRVKQQREDLHVCLHSVSLQFSDK